MKQPATKQYQNVFAKRALLAVIVVY
jgi:hypothetical protein